MIEKYRIVKGPIGFNVEGYFNITFKRNWFERLFGFQKGIYGWHLLDETGGIWNNSIHLPMLWKPAIYSSLKEAQQFIEWQKSVGKVVQTVTE